MMQNQSNAFQGKINEFTPDKGLYQSALGTPVMQDITFQSVMYTDPITGNLKKTQEIKLIDILLKVKYRLENRFVVVSAIVLKTKLRRGMINRF